MNQLPYQIDTGFGLVEPFLPLQQQDTDYCEFSGEEDDMSERDLAENAQWKKIQQNTFTRWANEHLKLVSGYISDLERDLSDGLLLIALVEVLARKKLPKYNKKPSFRSQKLENVSLVLKFLQEDEGIKIVNIDSTHIVDCKLKLILGLIWTLILHYSISMPLWEGEDLNGTDSTPKQRLMNWIKTKLPPELPVRNFTTDWNDGKAIGALVDSVAPGLCPDWEDWDGRNNLGNATEAIDLASKWLDVPQLIQPEEMVNPNVDEQSVMTYLSQFPNAKIKPGAPLRPKHSINKIRVYGKGVESKSLPAGQATNFFIESSFPLLHERLDVFVENSKKQRVPVNITSTNNDHTHLTASYNPKTEGNHSVNVKVNGQHVPKSPFNVQVESEASTVSVFGPGVKPEGVPVNETTYFDVTFKNNNDECKPPKIIITDPDGNENVIPIKTYNLSSNHWRCEYVPKTIGPHSVNLYLGDNHAPIFHSKVTAFSTFDVKKVKASGRGLQPKGVRVQDIADFKIYAGGTEPEAPEIQILGPGKDAVPHKIQKSKDGTYHVEYQPVKEGRHVIIIKVAGQEIHKSPFEIDVGPYKKTAIEAFGPGLVGGIVNYPALFTVETNGETAALGFKILGPSQAKIEFHDNGDGSADVRYYPTAPGEYAIHILRNNEDIPRSPYIAEILPKAEYKPENVDVYGPGLEPNSLKQNVPSSFTVDTRKAGNADLNVTIRNGNAENVPVHVVEKSEGLYEFSYIPKNNSSNTIHVTFGGVAVKNSPYRVNVQPTLDVSKVSCYGPINGEDVKVNSPSYFTVDVKDAGEADLTARLINTDKNEEVPIKLVNNGDGTYTVQYKPIHVGTHSLSLCYGGVEVPGSPKFKVIPNIDVSQIKVEGLESTAPVNSLQQFRIIAQDVGKADLAISITSPSGSKIKAHVIPTHEGYLVNFTPTQLGEHLLGVSFDGMPLSFSPFKITCLNDSYPSKVKAYGQGLHRGIVNRNAEFTIDTRGAGQSGLCVTLEGPCEAPINCRDNGDGTCSVTYLPTKGGDYIVNITFNNEHIPGSPFHAIVVPDVDINKFRVTGNGLSRHGVYVGSPTDIVIDTKDPTLFNSDQVTCKITNPSGTQTKNIITNLPDGTYKISFTPFEEGRHTIDIFYDNIPVPGSPFTVNVKRGSDAKKCSAHGPGLEKGVLNKPNNFTIETKGAGTGGLSLAIEGPSEAKMTCKDNRDGSCNVEYFPTQAGEYEISVRFDDKPIPGSPFKVQVESDSDETLVTAFGPGLATKTCRSGTPAHFTIDVSKAKPAPVAVQITSDSKPVIQSQINDNGDGTFDVSYVPPNEGTNLQIKVLYDEKDIPGSPFPITVQPSAEPEKVKLYGKTLQEGRIPASLPTDIQIDTSEAGLGDLEVNVIGPDGHLRPVILKDKGNGVYKASFVPDDCGQYKLYAKYGGKDITKTPVAIQAHPVGQAKECEITRQVKETSIGEKNCIRIDTKNSGNGAVTCKIKSLDGKDIDVKTVDNGDGTISILFSILEPGEYTVNIKYGGQTIPGGTYKFVAKEYKANENMNSYENHIHETRETRETRTMEYKETQHQDLREIYLNNIPLLTTGGHVTAEIKMPSGKVDKPIIEDNHDGTVTIKYDPREEGVHELAVKFNGEHIQGSPYKIHVDSISSGYVTAYGSGLTHGVTGEPSNFTISTKGAGAGGLSMAVEGPSKAEINCHDNKDGTVSVSYLPTAPGEYKISIRFGDKHIKGSPFLAKVTGEGRKRNQISVGSCSEVSLPGKISDSDIRSLNASIQAPSGLEEPCFLKRLPTGNIGISFTPREVGEHIVSVKRLGNHITNSPFKINVCEREVGDAKKVKVTGGALKDGKTHTDNTFTVDTRNAGFGGLSLSIEGPSKAEIQCNDNSDGTLNISYKPTEPGYYIVNLKFADHHVDGSPFTVKVVGEGSNRQREKIQRQREAVPITEVGSQCKLTFKMPGITSFDLSATVTSPGGVTEDAEINEVKDGLYAVHFVPKELGIHTVSVKYKEIHIPGSPFQFTVGPYRDHGAHLVKAGGGGLERGEQGEINEFNVWTREAGSGQLAISVEGPSKAEINFADRKDGSCDVSYKVSEPGEYRIGLKFNDEHIPDSPFKVYISPAVGDAHLLEVAQFPEGAIQPDKPSQFIIRRNGAKGDLDAKVAQFPEGAIQPDKPSQFIIRRNGAKGDLDAKIVGPSGIEDDCFVQIIDMEEYSVRFMPRENGVHKIHCKFNGVHIPGSPYCVKVGKDTADPAAVHAHGNGLNQVKTGVKTDFIVDTVNAGSGTLAVSIDGPSKVSMDCTEVEEGYKVRYTPLAPGDYYISIKYNNHHIVGSPYKVNSRGDAKQVADLGGQETSSVVVETVSKVAKDNHKGPVMPTFKSDASKVQSKGMGLKKAYIGKQNQFTVSAQNAGVNILFVGIHGPKGPCEEVFIKHQGHNQYAVNYIVRDRGDYLVIVKWGDDQIPGSPFKVEV